MEFTNYNEIVKSWVQGVYDNHQKDAELTLKYCNDIIEYAGKVDDAKLLGFGYYYIAEVYYILNDGDSFFATISKAMSYLEKAEEWELIARSYNIFGIIAMNRGNLPIAYDYYLNGLVYCKKIAIPEVEIIIKINCGALNIQGKQYSEAEKFLYEALELAEALPKDATYHSYMICIHQNIAICLVLQGKLDGVDSIFRRIHGENWENADYIDHIGVLCAEALFYHRSGNYELRDECIAHIDGNVANNIAFMDIFDDLYTYCELLLECDKDKEFWNIIDTLEPMIRSFNITNMQLKEISLKIKYYRKHSQNAEYLQAAGLYYELSERREVETRDMINNVLFLRKSLEKANEAKHEVELQNKILEERSEHDPLTGLANRFKLNDYADKLFSKTKKAGTSFAIEILDIDYFKEFNDNYGHQAGDNCLLMVSECINKVVSRHNGFCARYGGDEFVIIYEDITPDMAMDYVKELKKEVMDKCMEHKYSKAIPIVTISQGMCCDFPTKTHKVWDFLHIADDMLYKIKKQNRNNYCVGNIEGEVYISR